MAEKATPVGAWLKEHEASFAPPVCNKLMYGNGTQHKVMFVGGPNVRKDYHLNQGEEFFYMIKGSMLLKVMEHGKPKDIPIKEGEVFLLPGGVPHSPNRPEQGSLGLVIERERLAEETDGIRWYVDDSNEAILYERWFHCEDLGTQLAPLIKGYFASEEHKTRVPSGDIGPPAFEPNTTSPCLAPFSLAEWLATHKEEIDKHPVALFDSEFQLTVYGAGGAFEGQPGKETFVWQLKGTSVVRTASGEVRLREDDCHVVQSVAELAERSDDSRVLVCQSVRPNPFAAVAANKDTSA